VLQPSTTLSVKLPLGRRAQNIILAFGTAQISQSLLTKKITSGLRVAILKCASAVDDTVSQTSIRSPRPKYNFSIWNGSNISTRASEKTTYDFRDTIFKYGVDRRSTLSVKYLLDPPPLKHYFSI
jgi:hypothetical protein